MSRLPADLADGNLRICKNALAEFHKSKAFAVSRLFVPGKVALSDRSKLLKTLL